MHAIQTVAILLSLVGLPVGIALAYNDRAQKDYERITTVTTTPAHDLSENNWT